MRGMTLAPGQQVISLVVADDETKSVLTATENGYGKRTPVAEYTRHGRGTQGMIAIQTTARNGKVVAARLVTPEDEIMLITTGGVLIRTRVAEIREMGRATQGVTLINLGDGREAGRPGEGGGNRRERRSSRTTRCRSESARASGDEPDNGSAMTPDADDAESTQSGIDCMNGAIKVRRVFNFSPGPAVLPRGGPASRRATRCSTGTAAACRSWR